MITSPVSTPRLPGLARAASPAEPQERADTPQPPLQNRTPEQLRDGLVVKVKGAGSDDLAVARLIQDGAMYVAQTAGTTMGPRTSTSTTARSIGPAPSEWRRSAARTAGSDCRSARLEG